MKKLQLVLVSLGLAISASSFAQVAIGTDEIHSSAILHLESDINKPKGFLLPTMTNAERLAILSPAEGLQVYVTDFEDGIIMLYDGTEWKAFTKLITCPDAPTNIKATFSNNEATISFKVPTINGGSTITKYTATSSSGDIGTTFELDLSGNGSITFSELTDNKFYTFTVTATNDVDTSLPSEPSNVVPAPKVGDFYQSGVVFYILTSDDRAVGYVDGETHGLICAPNDLEGSYKWSPDGAQEVTGTNFRMGYGKTNTEKIIDKLEEDNTGNKNYAAYQATLYDAGDGYQDWYLPSKHELNKIYEQRELINTELLGNEGTVFKDSFYWSSSEHNLNDAWLQNLDNGTPSQGSKEGANLVRPVRSF